MMILKAFCLLDTKTGIYHAPYFCSHLGVAVRAVKDLGADQGTTVGRHPADYALLEVGEFDDQTGALVPCLPKSLGSVVSFLDEQPPLPLKVVGDRGAL